MSFHVPKILSNNTMYTNHLKISKYYMMKIKYNKIYLLTGCSLHTDSQNKKQQWSGEGLLLPRMIWGALCMISANQNTDNGATSQSEKGSRRQTVQINNTITSCCYSACWYDTILIGNTFNTQSISLLSRILGEKKSAHWVRACLSKQLIAVCL